MRKYSFIFAAVLVLAACRQVQPQAFSVIPMPAEVTVTDGSYAVAGKAFFLDPRLDNASQDAIWTRAWITPRRMPSGASKMPWRPLPAGRARWGRATSSSW